MNKQDLCAVFYTILPKENTFFGGRRAVHVIHPELNCYVHRTYWVVDKDTPDNLGIFLSDRVFFGRWRLAFVEDRHTAETWARVAQSVKELERVKPL